MKNLLRVSITLTLAIICLTIVETSSAISEDKEITSPMPNGTWINETLNISGSTTINPQNAEWVIYNVTDPYDEWTVVVSGNYFSSVVPVDEGIWIWYIEVNVTGLNCTCWLEVNQPLELDKVFFNRILFIGEGPHNPVISPKHESNIYLDENVELHGNVYLSTGILEQSKIKISWCHSPQGACTNQTYTSDMTVSWDEESYSFTLNATELDLFDGRWNIVYYLQDEFLRDSPIIETTIFVDRTDPVVDLIAVLTAYEGEELFIDGSGSRDGVWGNKLQTLWYITLPDGTLNVIDNGGTQKLTHTFVPQSSGTYTVKLDVFDSVGRTASKSVEIVIENLPPEFNFEIDGLNVSLTEKWETTTGESHELSAEVIDTESDKLAMNYKWYLDESLVSENENYTIADLDPGTYTIRLEIEDDDGAIHTKNFDLVVESIESAEENNRLTLLASIILLVAIGGIMIFFFIRKGNPAASDLPKWTKKQRQEITDATEDDDDWN